MMAREISWRAEGPGRKAVAVWSLFVTVVRALSIGPVLILAEALVWLIQRFTSDLGG
jgi:hypothetical protein